MKLQEDKFFFDALMISLYIDKPFELSLIRSALKKYGKGEKQELIDYMKSYIEQVKRDIDKLEQEEVKLYTQEVPLCYRCKKPINERDPFDRTLCFECINKNKI